MVITFDCILAFNGHLHKMKEADKLGFDISSSKMVMLFPELIRQTNMPWTFRFQRSLNVAKFRVDRIKFVDVKIKRHFLLVYFRLSVIKII